MFFVVDGFGVIVFYYVVRIGRIDCVKWLVEIVGIFFKVCGRSGVILFYDVVV